MSIATSNQQAQTEQDATLDTVYTVYVQTDPPTRQPRLGYLHVHPRYFIPRALKVDLLAFQPGALFVTITGSSDNAAESARLALVPPSFAKALAKFARKLSKRGGTYAIRLATRTKHRVWHPHAHGVVLGLTAARIETLAHNAGLTAHVEPVRDPYQAGRYIMDSKQATRYDRSPGRTFWSNARPKAVQA